MMKYLLSAAMLCVLFAGQLSAESHDDHQFKWIEIGVGDKQLEVEYADTFELRAMGLQFREKLCADCGMLFKFDSRQFASMWMKNTYIPLDVAFIDAKGKIIDIKPMQPLDLTSVGSSKQVLYALEMNQGWFASNEVVEGDLIRDLP